MDPLLDIRPSSLAGQWYPADRRHLAESVDKYLAAARLPEISGKVIGVVAPHAGHRYSGPVAGYAFAALRGLRPELVALVAPMHHLYLEPFLTSAHAGYSTPLGTIPIDQEAVQELNTALEATLGFGMTPVWRDPEHSLEIELPFLQRALAGEFNLLPVMVREQSAAAMRALGAALAKTLRGREAILVASTDLSHFYSQDIASKLDAELLRRLAAFDPEGVLKAEEEGVGFACGRAPLAAVLWAAAEMGADTVQVLHHATSGDVTGDFIQVVGYGAAVILKQN